MKSKRGISPLIATVLLIGFTIVLAALIMQWGSSLLKEQTETTGTTSKAQIACSTEVDFTLDKAVVNGASLDVTLTNNRDRPLVDFIARIKYNSGTLAGTTETVTSIIGTVGQLGSFASKKYSIVKTVAAGDSVDIIPKIDINGNQVACSEQIKTKTVE